VVDVFIDELDLSGLGFEGGPPAVTGRPAYHPAVLLKFLGRQREDAVKGSAAASFPPAAFTCVSDYPTGTGNALHTPSINPSIGRNVAL
jgi:hypothetical protein